MIRAPGFNNLPAPGEEVIMSYLPHSEIASQTVRNHQFKLQKCQLLSRKQNNNMYAVDCYCTKLHFEQILSSAWEFSDQPSFFFKLLKHSQKTLFNQFKLQKCQIRTYSLSENKTTLSLHKLPTIIFSHWNISKRPYFSICFLHRVCFKNWKIIIELKKSWLMHLCALKNLAFFGCA